MTDLDLKKAVRKALDGVVWPIKHGTVTVKIRDGKPTLHTIELTDKLD